MMAAVVAWQKTVVAKRAEETALEAQQNAEAARKIAEDNLFALQQEKARALEDRGDEFFRFREFDSAKYEYEKALKLLPPEAKNGRERLAGKLKSCESALEKTE